MRRRNRSRLDCICERLLHSRNAAERRSLFVGRTCHQGFPVLLDADLLCEHMHILGPTGIGKSTLGLHTYAVQLIYQGDGPVIIFDGKGDPALFFAVLEATRRTGRMLKWFTNKPYHSTYVFNPWNQKSLYRMTLPNVVALFMQALNLVHGEDYGRGWYSIFNRIMMRRGMELTIPDSQQHNLRRTDHGSRSKRRYQPIQSFYDLRDVLEDLSKGDDKLKDALHLCYLVESLTDFDQLNLAPNQAPNHPALAHAIHMPEVIREKQVIYFYLAGGADLAMVSMIIKLALFSLLAAAGDYLDEHGEPPKIYSIFDEAQVMIAQNIANVMAMAGLVGPDVACPDTDGAIRINIHEFTGPRLNSQDILDASRGRNTSLMWIDRASGLSRFNGWFPLYTDWPTSVADYR